MAYTVLLQKTTASYVPRFNFGGPFLDDKSDFQIANFQHFRIFAKINNFQKFPRATIFKVEGCAFGFWPLTSKTRPLLKKNIENILR